MCAIESAAKNNPDWDVFVLFASQVGFWSGFRYEQPLIKILLSYPNVYLRNVNIWAYSANTPMSRWIQKDLLFQSNYLHAHVADYMRLLSLYKFGGTYMDLDVVVQKPLDTLGQNYAGSQSSKFIANGVMNFDADDTGHDIVELILKYDHNQIRIFFAFFHILSLCSQ